MTFKRLCAVPGCGNKHLARGYCSKHYRRLINHGSPEGGADHFKSPEEAFAARTVQRDSGCLEWTGAKIEDSYGMLKVCGKSTLVHRYSYERSIGPVPDGMKVLHHCDNPPCCNPDHLFLGTDQDNVTDMFAKGRGRKARGAAHGRTNLTDDDVRAIRADPRSLHQLAAVYGVGKSTIGHIKEGKNWDHVK